MTNKVGLHADVVLNQHRAECVLAKVKHLADYDASWQVDTDTQELTLEVLLMDGIYAKLRVVETGRFKG